MSRPMGMMGRATRSRSWLGDADAGAAVTPTTPARFLEAFVHAGGEGEEGFAGAGGAHEGDHLDIIIEKEVEGHDLLDVARGDAEDRLFGTGEREHGIHGGDEAGEAGLRFAGLQEDVFVGEKFWGEAGEDGICDRDLFVGVEAVDDGRGDGEFAIAGVEGFVIDLLIFKILGGDAEGVGLDAGVDVLGDEDGIFAGVHEAVGDGDDAVVGLVEGEAGDGVCIGVHGDLNDAAVAVPLDAVVEVAFFAQGVYVADGLARGAADIGGILFEFVELFQDIKGDDDVVVGKGKKRAGVVEKDVGVEHEEFDVGRWGYGGGVFGHPV